MLPRLILALTLLAAAPAAGQTSTASSGIAQLYSYRLTDPARFRDGYRSHLSWHARHGDVLVWYAWTVQSGPRRGLFIDGTAGASLAGLDQRPDPAGDGADFAATAGPHAQAVDIETWALWPDPSTASPLEDRKPTALLDVFLLEVAPRDAAAFERAVSDLVGAGRRGTTKLTWYRKLRGGTLPAYMLILSRQNWVDVEASGATLQDLLSRSYGSSGAAVEAMLSHVSAASVETWSYEPRLSLLPGQPLAP